MVEIKIDGIQTDRNNSTPVVVLDEIDGDYKRKWRYGLVNRKRLQ
jgi:hypothetical protein